MVGDRREHADPQQVTLARAARAATSNARSAATSVARASGNNASPAGVSVTPRGPRASSSAPSRRSTSRTCSDSDCWATWSRVAAAVRLPASAIATK